MSNSYTPKRTLKDRVLNRIAKTFNLGKAFAPPWFVWLEPTQRCNLNCRVCARFYYGGDFEDIDPEVYQKFLDEILPAVSTVNLQGYGEPILHPRFKDMLDAVEQGGKSLSMICNGTTLRRPVMERLVKVGALVTLSIDGGSNETFKFVREHIDFDKMLSHLDTFAEIQKEVNNPDFEIWVNSVALRLNIYEIPEMIETLAAKGVSAVTLAHFDTAGRPDEFTEECLDRHPDLVREWFPKIREAGKRAGIRVDLPIYPFEHENGNGSTEIKIKESAPAKNGDVVISDVTTSSVASISADQLPEKMTAHQRKTGFRQKCFAPWERAHIDVHGDVRPCCMGQAGVMGNLKKQSFAEIWNGEKFQELRRTIHTKNPPDYCRTCPILFGINAGVPVDHSTEES